MGKILVACPGGLVTGGAEAAHQLVHELRRIGRDGYVSYWPFTDSHERQPAYRKYDAPTHGIEDRPGNLIVLPEIHTLDSRTFRHARCAIWWLSVDNYYRFPQNNPLRAPWVVKGNRLYDPVRRARTLWSQRLPLRALRGLSHFAQSHYARHFLERAGIHASMLTDYLSEEHLTPPPPGGERQDVVVYNPAKGKRITARLIEAFPQLRFVPIRNMTPGQVAALLRSSKVYADFGHHPGKDRPPREAVMAGCCVITSRSGAAAFEEDTPVPPDYRLDPFAPDFLTRFERTVADVFQAFPTRSKDFDGWRERVRGERALFESEVKEIFG